MSCKAEHDALTTTRRNFGRADRAVERAAQYYSAASIGALGGTGGFLLAIYQRASPTTLLISAAMFVGGWIGEEAAASNTEDAGKIWKETKDKYDAAKQDYCNCILSALPPDTG